MNMPSLTLIYGALLTVLGLSSFAFAGASSSTALTPAFFGVFVILAGIFGMKETYRKNAMHLAAAIALLAMLGSITGVVDMIKWLSGGGAEPAAAVISKTVMFGVSLIYAGLAVRYFLEARRTRAAAGR